MDFLLHHLLHSSDRRRGNRTALNHGQLQATYSKISTQVASLARGLRETGIQAGERVGVFLEPSIAQVISIFAIAQAGAVFIPIYPGLFPSQVAHIINDSGMTALISDGPRISKLEEILTTTPSLKFLIFDGGGQTSGTIPSFSFHQLCSLPPESDQPETRISKDLAALLYTSGSTGKPKGGVMLSHANLLAGASIVSDYLAIDENDRILAALPFSFDAGLNQLLSAVQQAGTLVLIKFLFARDIVRCLEKERITGLAGVPSLWALLAQPSSRLETTSLPDLRYITNTGGALSQNVLIGLRRALPKTRVFLMYGLTEAFRSTYLPPEELDARPGSIGRAIPDTQILVINEKGEECRPGEVGELVHHGPTVSMGYWGDAELTARVLRPHPFPAPGESTPDKVCYSGDLVKRDDDGFLYFVGRRDYLIKSSGFRVSPSEVEEALLSANGDLLEAAVIGVPDPMLGNLIKAFVVPREKTEVDLDKILASCAETLPRYMMPRQVEIV